MSIKEYFVFTIKIKIQQIKKVTGKPNLTINPVYRRVSEHY